MLQPMKAADYRRQARESLNKNWGIAVLTTFVATLLGGSTISSSGSAGSGSSSFSSGFESGFEAGANSPESSQAIADELARFISENQVLITIVSIVGIILSIWALATFILGGPTKIGLCKFNKNLYEGNGEAKLSNIFEYYDIFLKGFVANLLVTIYTVLWTLLFIIPGIIAAFSYSMTFYILADHPEMDANDAIKASKQMMKGHKWELFCLGLSFIGWIILSGFTLGIGYLFLAPYQEQAFYAFYRNISGTPSMSVTEELPVIVETPVVEETNEG